MSPHQSNTPPEYAFPEGLEAALAELAVVPAGNFYNFANDLRGNDSALHFQIARRARVRDLCLQIRRGESAGKIDESMIVGESIMAQKFKQFWRNFDLEIIQGEDPTHLVFFNFLNALIDYVQMEIDALETVQKGGMTVAPTEGPDKPTEVGEPYESPISTPGPAPSPGPRPTPGPPQSTKPARPPRPQRPARPPRVPLPPRTSAPAPAPGPSRAPHPVPQELQDMYEQFSAAETVRSDARDKLRNQHNDNRNARDQAVRDLERNQWNNHQQTDRNINDLESQTYRDHMDKGSEISDQCMQIDDYTQRQDKRRRLEAVEKTRYDQEKAAIKGLRDDLKKLREQDRKDVNQMREDNRAASEQERQEGNRVWDEDRRLHSDEMKQLSDRCTELMSDDPMKGHELYMDLLDELKQDILRQQQAMQVRVGRILQP